MNFLQAIGLLRPTRKSLWLIFAGLAVAASSMQGRLAETRAQIEARYGKALSQQDDKETTGMCVCRYEHDGLSIEATYIQNVCYGESYTWIVGGPLSADEMHVLLEANRCGLAWLTVEQTVMGQHTGEHRAEMTFDVLWFLCGSQGSEWCAAAGWEPDGEGRPGTTFSVRSASIRKYVEAVRAARAKTALKGF